MIITPHHAKIHLDKGFFNENEENEIGTKIKISFKISRLFRKFL
jgi:hypothetical protein